MNEYKIILASIASAIAVVSIIPYLWHIYKGITKPHAFTWLVWTLLTGIAFVAQLVSGAGLAALVLGITCATNFTVAMIGFWQGHVKYTRFDWIALFGAILAIILWRLTNNPLIAVVLVASSDVIGYLPTFRKAYYFPNEETLTTYGLGAVYFILSIIALKTFSVTNWLYPAVICLGNILFIAMTLYRRRVFNASDGV